MSLPKRLTESQDPEAKKRKTFAEQLQEEENKVNELEGEVGIVGDQVWTRPLPPPNWSEKDVTFQQIDAQEYRDPQVLRSVLVDGRIRLFGVTAEGHSVMCDIKNFDHYFYVRAPLGFNNENLSELVNAFGEDKANVKHISIAMKQNLWGYRGDEKVAFLQIKVHDPTKISILRRKFESQDSGIAKFNFEDRTYDNISYLLRCTIDCGIVGMSWITLPAGAYQVESGSSRCQIEVSIDFDKLVAHEADGEWLKSAPLRVMSFDIECSGRKGIFPDPMIDPVIQIANVVQIQGAQRPFIRNVFTLNTCSPIVGSQVLEHETEAEMLLRWSQFVCECDPDVIIGYNTTNFDFPYLLDRAQALDISDQFAYFGRLVNVQQVLTVSKFSSKAYGNSESRVVNLEGRIQIDMLQYIRREFKLRSYTLNNVSSRFLNEQKEDVHHSVIADLQNGDADTRYRLAVYCLKDAFLPLRLLDKLMAFVNMTEMARVTGVPISFLLSRGQQIKVISQLFRKCLQYDMLVPDMKQSGSTDEQFEGATVIEPIRGHHKLPIATLDFSSLYPSIMMAHNLCYSTLIDDNVVEQLKLKEGEDYVVTPHKVKFVKQSKRKGLLPIILDELISARKKAKNDLKNENDPFKRAVLDGRQLALKISANSVYGFTGATVGKLPCLAISSSVTSYGRDMIEATKAFVEKHYTKANGYEHDSKVIYGDTDSVMVKFGTDSLAESMRLGEEAADLVSKIFINPIKLEFEKVYYPYLLINKKRYAGLLWTNPNKFDKMDTKGIETVRRDNCKLVQYVVETVLQKILIDRNEDAAQEFVKQTIRDLVNNRVDMSLLIISKQLSRTDYASKQAHSELAARMQKRDPGSAPALGDRIPYVICIGGANAKTYDKSEDPAYAIENDLRVDTEYYLENQLKNPLTRIFEPILGPEKTETLLSTSHVRTRKLAKGGFSMFGNVKTVQACKGCRRPLTGMFENSVVCANCLDRVPELYLKELVNMNELQTRYNELWTECQSCQESVQHDVICAAQDCPIFFMRRTVQINLTQSQKEMKKFDMTW